MVLSYCSSLSRLRFFEDAIVQAKHDYEKDNTDAQVRYMGNESSVDFMQMSMP